MNVIKCFIKEVKKVEGEFYELNVEVLKQDMRYFAFNFRNKLYLIEEKNSRVSQRVKDSLQFTLSREKEFNESLDILLNTEYIEINL